MSDSFISWLRSNSIASWFLTLLRVGLGAEFILAASSKVGNAMWTGDQAGSAVSQFVQHSLTLSQGPVPEVLPWYSDFLNGIVLPNASFFSHLVTWGELLVGIGLVLGSFTSIALGLGFVMNMSYLLAGVSGINPWMILAESILLVGGFNTAKKGVDYWLCGYLGKTKSYKRNRSVHKR